ncbi:oxidoreductase family, NAD-binding rossmann fold domain-containing protein [Ditylenchus destructor]|uniref:Oxidoreductase family, NAD-binding rossmann fold domain-containing protein n=1 Tax=Ditylenchus destructor TaxID=166010 RepID=A0AAD4QU29_9BILA|nr:oxidoreductase family, NAD-binding rossmann fold domain-containing protein [Ditylenchus destructor]
MSDLQINLPNFDTKSLRQWWPKPINPRHIVIFGAGSIAGDAHLPAYMKAGFPISGIFDPNNEKAKTLAEKWGIRAFKSESEALSTQDAVFDLATPPAIHASVLRKLPRGSFVLIQKPMGSNLVQASEILQICRERDLKAAVNFQLRFAPVVLALNDAIQQNVLGDIVDFDATIAVDTPWDLFPFLKKEQRIEITMHSIHYFDLIRSFLGNPLGVHAKTIGHPSHNIAQTRTSALLDYGDNVRCALSVNHDHKFGREFQTSEFRVCGTRGAAFMKLGVNLGYPKGEPDELWIRPAGGSEWLEVNLEGSWFPDAFTNRMANLLRFSTGEDDFLISSVEDAWQTMALVEAAYQSNMRPATPIETFPSSSYNTLTH